MDGLFHYPYYDLCGRFTPVSICLCELLNMKKLIKSSLLFVLFFTGFTIVVNTCYFLIIAGTDWDFRKRIESLTLKNPDFEILVMGNSLPEYGIDTELLTSKGIKSYNLSIIGNSDQTSYIQLMEYLSMYSDKPHTILYGVAAYEDAFYNKGIHPIVDFSMKGHKYGIRDVPLFKFRWFGVEFLKKIISRSHRQTEISLGQIKSPRVIPDGSVHGSSPLLVKTIGNSYWIGQMAQLCRENGINLLIIEMPGMKETQNDSVVGPQPVVFENHDTVQLYNFNSREFCGLFDANKDWCGLSHLNMYGASKFTNELYDYLIREKIILK
jgi:hypothetical protein